MDKNRITQKITPFLWFDDKAEEAAKFYTSIFKNSKIGDIARYDEEAAKPTGRPHTCLSEITMPVMKSSYSPVGLPVPSKGRRTTL